jgi:hypothetical protein
MIAATQAPIRVEIVAAETEQNFAEFLAAVEHEPAGSAVRLSSEARLFTYLATRATLQAESAKAQEIGALNRRREAPVGVSG